MSRRTLEQLVETQHNSFNAVRLIAAAAVFVSHAFLVVPFGVHGEPLDGFAYNLGQISVNVFFFLSGMMLSRSFALRPHLGGFVVARVLRIFPGLLVCGAITAWIIGPISTALDLTEYFSDPASLFYPLLLPLQFNGASLPGVFSFGLEPGEVNVPLWTIKYELFAYMGFVLVAMSGIAGRRLLMTLLCSAFAVLLIIAFASHMFDTSAVGSLIRFGFCFTLGMAAYLNRSRIVLSWPLAAVALVLALLLSPTPLGQVASVAGFGYVALVVGASHIPWLTNATNKADISYGFYLYSFPIQQLLIAHYGTDLPAALAMGGLAAIISLTLAYLSWIFIEKPALSLKKRLPKASPELKPSQVRP